VRVAHGAIDALRQGTPLATRRHLRGPQRQLRVPAWVTPGGKQAVERAASKEDPRT